METVKEITGNTLTLTISGHIDATSAPALEKIVNENSAAVEKMIFNFDKVEYISSAGLRVLLATHKTMTSKGGDFTIVGVNNDVRNILEMTGFMSFLKVK